nr:unnamed protein product [Callosobruchus analis]
MDRTNRNASQQQQDQWTRSVSGQNAAMASEYFEQFVNASSLKHVLGYYRGIIDNLHLRPTVFTQFYPKLRANLTSWRAKALWKKFDARAAHKCYSKGRAAPNTRVLIIGGGPCGLRTAIEAQLLGAKVVLVEKRDRFSRNNVLHLWPFVIEDLRMLGAKKFFGKFCAGAIDHISIRQLQCILLKAALLLGVEVHTEVGFERLIEPQADEKIGWRAELDPPDHPVSQYEFDVIIGADGKRNTLQGFTRKEFRYGGLEELHETTRIDLENIVYYKDDTHYFVMTAKKASLLEKGVIKQDLADTEKLLAPENVDRDALEQYAIEAANFSTNYQLPDLEFAVNHYGQPDIAMFDFTSMYAAENASKTIQQAWNECSKETPSKKHRLKVHLKRGGEPSKDLLSDFKTSKPTIKKHSCLNKRTDSDIPVKTKKRRSTLSTRDAKSSKSVISTRHCKPLSSRSSQSSGRKKTHLQVVYRNTSPNKKRLKKESERKGQNMQNLNPGRSNDDCSSDILAKKKRKQSSNDLPVKARSSVMKQPHSNSKTMNKNEIDLTSKQSQTAKSDYLYRDPQKETVKQFMARIMLKRKKSILRKICNLSVIQEKKSEPEKTRNDPPTENNAKAEEVKATPPEENNKEEHSVAQPHVLSSDQKGSYENPYEITPDCPEVPESLKDFKIEHEREESSVKNSIQINKVTYNDMESQCEIMGDSSYSNSCRNSNSYSPDHSKHFDEKTNEAQDYFQCGDAQLLSKHYADNDIFYQLKYAKRENGIDRNKNFRKLRSTQEMNQNSVVKLSGSGSLVKINVIEKKTRRKFTLQRIEYSSSLNQLVISDKADLSDISDTQDRNKSNGAFATNSAEQPRCTTKSASKELERHDFARKVKIDKYRSKLGRSIRLCCQTTQTMSNSDVSHCHGDNLLKRDSFRNFLSYKKRKMQAIDGISNEMFSRVSNWIKTNDFIEEKGGKRMAEGDGDAMTMVYTASRITEVAKASKIDPYSGVKVEERTDIVRCGNLEKPVSSEEKFVEMVKNLKSTKPVRQLSKFSQYSPFASSNVNLTASTPVQFSVIVETEEKESHQMMQRFVSGFTEMTVVTIVLFILDIFLNAEQYGYQNYIFYT